MNDMGFPYMTTADPDHREIGNRLNLFHFHPHSPGSCFFTARGTKVYNALLNLMKDTYWEYDFEEVMTPNIYDLDLWKTSGHATHFLKHMFVLDVDNRPFGLKPMNCPGHCLLFDSAVRSYRDLPIRLADFGTLHRNEYSGALSGLLRTRRFRQDDAHIFCRHDQLGEELKRCLVMVKEVYSVLGLSFRACLSTRPDKAMGDAAMWTQAEEALATSMTENGIDFTVQRGEGAFYGPKCDFVVLDGRGKEFQCATMQLDFQLPINFGLKFVDVEGTARPVIIHRAILGSFERMVAILTEHYGGRFPLWMSPYQVAIIPITTEQLSAANRLKALLKGCGVHGEVVDPICTLNKRIRDAQASCFNYIAVMGKREVLSDTVSVRLRDNGVVDGVSVSDMCDKLKTMVADRSRREVFN